MKKTLLTAVFVCFSAGLSAQQTTAEIQRIVDAQYANPLYKEFIYQVSPQTKSADEWLIQSAERFEENKNRPFSPEAASDRINHAWMLRETFNGEGGEPVLTQFRDSYIEDGTSYVTSGAWNSSQGKWQYTNTIVNAPDSSVTLNYTNGVPYYGTRIRVVTPPADGAVNEYYSDTYSTADGGSWINNLKIQEFENTDGYTTVKKQFRYTPETSQYLPDSFTKRKGEYVSEPYYLLNLTETETYNYMDGMLAGTSIQSTEAEEEWSVSENKYLDGDGEVITWTQTITRRNDSRPVYSVSKSYDSDMGKLIATDSLHYIYTNNDMVTEAWNYTWDFEGNEYLDSFYKNFSSEHSSGKTVPDSTLVYNLVLNEISGEREPGNVIQKTLNFYDSEGNQTEVHSYTTINGELTLSSKILRTHVTINGNLFQTSQKTYAFNASSSGLYLSQHTETEYDENTPMGLYPIQLSSLGLYYNSNGEVTSGNKSKMETFLNHGRGTYYYKWDVTREEFVFDYLYISNIINERETGDPSVTQLTNIGQSNSGNPVGWREGSASNSNHLLFNDGPIFAEVGDTLSFYVSGWVYGDWMNEEMTRPRIEVENMPATATYDSETRHFYWIVDEAAPAPMKYKSVHDGVSLTQTVEFSGSPVTTGAEEYETPAGFELAQNYPNPFNPSTNIRFTLQQSGNVSLKVFNLLGQEVAELINGRMSAGVQTVQFDARNLASGVYLYRLTAGGKTVTKSMMLIK